MKLAASGCLLGLGMASRFAPAPDGAADRTGQASLEAWARGLNARKRENLSRFWSGRVPGNGGVRAGALASRDIGVARRPGGHRLRFGDGSFAPDRRREPQFDRFKRGANV
ncbi:hypothetical protein BGLA2_460022 [Burkholderia gladioli]|nr:hypothetical protein BGLA2_460022 [Burkholderia gladioli]